MPKLAERLAGSYRGNLGISLYGDADLAVPQDLHGREGEGGESAGPAGAMHGNLGNLGGGDASGEAAVEVPRLKVSIQPTPAGRSPFRCGLRILSAVHARAWKPSRLYLLDLTMVHPE